MITILIYHFILLAQLYLVCRNKTVSIKELLQTFAVGATMGVFGNFIVQGIFSQILGGDVVSYTIGPISEEIFKIAFVVFVLFKTRMGRTASIEDGALLGAAAGAGFGFTEDTVRAVGRGFEFMQSFPGYDLSMTWNVLISWLPSERSMTSVLDGQFIAGHLIWTALVGLGVGFALRLKMKWRFLIPLLILIWVTVDHSLANKTDSALGFLYPLYGYGMGVRYVFTILLIAAVIWDNRLINRFLPKDEKLFVPGEKRRSFLGELVMTLLNIRFGFTHWRALTAYFSFRRQLAFATLSQEKTDDFFRFLIRQKLCVIASARFENKKIGISQGIKRVWLGPSLSFGKMTIRQKFWLSALVVSGLSSFFVGWLLLFSVYFPHGITVAVIRNPLFAVLASLGYIITIVQFVEFYRRRQWKKGNDAGDRVGAYSNAMLVHSSVLTGFIFSPGFFGRSHPLLGGTYFWGQFGAFWGSLGGYQQWVGGTVSAGIGFIPIIGNIKSGFEAVGGYDSIAGQPVTGWNRVFAAIGAVPLVGNVVRGAQMSARMVRVVKTAEAIDKVAGYVNFGQAAKSDLRHAYDEIGKALTPLPVAQAKVYANTRDQIIQRWQDNGAMKSTGSGSYSLPVSGKKIEVYLEKNGSQTLGLKTEQVGQISVDHNNKSVLFDTITKEHGQSSADFDSTIKSLREKFPDYDIIEQRVFDDGFSRFDVVSGSGAKSQFYSVPTNSSYSPRVASVGSR